MIRTLILLTVLLTAACASPRGSSIEDSPLGAEALGVGETAQPPPAGILSGLGNALADHWKDSLAGMAFTTRSLARNIARDSTLFSRKLR